MSDKILSPDGKQEWNGQKWVPISGHSTTPGAESIVNYAELCVDALNRGDMAAAKDYYGKAKELDFKTATRVFESEYSEEIGRGYADIVESKLANIIGTNFSTTLQVIDIYTCIYHIEGDFEMDLELQDMEISFNNAMAFLGNPSELIVGGAFAVRKVFLELYDDDGDGIADSLQRELTYKDFSKMENDIDLSKKVVENLEISNLPDIEVIKQQFRIGLALELASMHILCKLTPALKVAAMPPQTNHTQVTHLNQKISRAESASDLGRSSHLAASALAIRAGLPIESWKKEDYKVIHSTLLSLEKGLNDYKSRPQENYSTCFIASAAYGTPYDSKIDVLRNWRDDSLKTSSGGRFFVKSYYLFSPPVASIVSKSSLLRMIVRIILSPIIRMLKPKYSRPRNNRFRNR